MVFHLAVRTETGYKHATPKLAQHVQSRRRHLKQPLAGASCTAAAPQPPAARAGAGLTSQPATTWHNNRKVKALGPGDAIGTGDVVVVPEAMKTQNNITKPGRRQVGWQNC